MFFLGSNKTNNFSEDQIWLKGSKYPSWRPQMPPVIWHSCMLQEGSRGYGDYSFIIWVGFMDACGDEKYNYYKL